MSWLRRTAPVVAIAIVCLAVYSLSLGGEFVWDDRTLIVENRLLRSPSETLRLFVQDFWDTGDGHDRFRSFYRPLVSASYALDYALWGRNPLGFHVTNLLLHIACSAMVYLLARQSAMSVAASTIGAALFAVHPVHVESVAWISGRTDLVCALALLASFSLAMHARKANTHRLGFQAASAVLFGIALLAKEMAITLPLLIVLAEIISERSPRRWCKAARAVMLHALVLVVYIGLRASAVGLAGHTLYDLHALGYAATAVFALARYLVLLILPLGLDAHYPYQPLTSSLNIVVLVSSGILWVVGWAAWRLRYSRPAASFWIVWTVLTLAPVLLFGRFGDVIMADRFLYIPSIGWAMLAAIAAHEVHRAPQGLPVRRWLAGAGAAVWLILATITIDRASVWDSDTTLFSEMVQTSPHSGLVRTNLGLAYYEQGDLARAIEELSAAVRLAPDYAMAHNNLGAAYEKQGKLELALKHYREAVRLAPRHLAARVNTARVLVHSGRAEQGLAQLDALVAEYPRYAPGLYALADTYRTLDSKEHAMRYAQLAAASDPDYPNAHYLIGKLLFERGDLQPAASSMKRFLSLWPGPGPHRQAAQEVVRRAAAAWRPQSDLQRTSNP
ncbi:MAG: tetratricopeptide repeat protein [Acidobacteriota bacterium]|nr:MAG: tetratricopeptide repeat protein [Acidobacteriota bacterium]